jgi:hypothetical protein
MLTSTGSGRACSIAIVVLGSCVFVGVAPRVAEDV